MIDTAVRRAQVYRFLSTAFLYPAENWLEDVPLINAVLGGLMNGYPPEIRVALSSLDEMQAAHRRSFGSAGSLCYETEWGIPNEFRHAQELADIAGFYRAFGFAMGSQVRERPDHITAELEFMSVMALKEAYAVERGIAEHAEVCVEAQRKFLADHLGRWIVLFAEYFRRAGGDGPYPEIASFAEAFVKADAACLGVTLEQPRLADVRPTPPGPELSCGDCPLAGQ